MKNRGGMYIPDIDNNSNRPQVKRTIVAFIFKNLWSCTHRKRERERGGWEQGKNKGERGGGRVEGMESISISY